MGKERTGIAAQIYTARREARLSREALATNLQCSRDTILNWENGISEPRHGDLLRIAEATNQNIAFFFCTQPCHLGNETA